MKRFTNTRQLLILQRQLTVCVLAVLLLFGLFQLGVYFSETLRILAISLLVSYLMINAVDFLDRLIHNRALSVALVYILLLAIVVVSSLLVIPAVVYQVSQLIATTVDKIPELLEKMAQALIPLQQRFHQSQLDIKVIDIVNNVASSLPKPDPGAVVTRITDMAMGTMTWTIYTVSISVVTFYFLLDGYKMKAAIIKLFPSQHRPMLDTIASDMDKSLQSFFLGQLVLGIVFGFVMLIVYMILKVQYALLLSVFLAFCEILPVVGPPIGFAPAIIAVAVHGTILPGARIAQILMLTLIFMVLQQVKDNVIAPRYIGNVIGLHPVLIFIAIMIGARLDGMFGIIIALPAASVINVLINHLSRESEPPASNNDTDADLVMDVAEIEAEESA